MGRRFLALVVAPSLLIACGAFGTSPGSDLPPPSPEAGIDADASNVEIDSATVVDAEAGSPSPPCPPCSGTMACDRGTCQPTSCVLGQTGVIVPLTQIAPESEHPDIEYIGGNGLATVTEVTPHDGDATFLTGRSSGLTFVLFDHGPLPKPASFTKLMKIVVKVVAKRTSVDALTLHLGFWRAAGNTRTSEQPLIQSYAEYLHELPLDPFTTQPWTLDALDTMKVEVAIDHKGTTGRRVNLTWVRLEACFQ